VYLLDTDIVSNLMRRAPSLALVGRLAALRSGERFTSSITIGELVYGAFRVTERATSIMRRLEEVLFPLGRVLPFDGPAARRYGELRAELERRGTPIGEADTRIAAIALAHGLTVVTGNVRHFARVPGLVVENWLA